VPRSAALLGISQDVRWIFGLPSNQVIRVSTGWWRLPRDGPRRPASSGGERVIRGCSREIVSEKRKEMEKEEEDPQSLHSRRLSLLCKEYPCLCTRVATHFSPQAL
jgi:hypothetical protein